MFARRPEQGHVKTRLAKAVGDADALALHRAFLADTLEAARATGTEVFLVHTAGAPFPEQTQADRSVTQQGDDFAERFDHALHTARERLGPHVPFVLVGADSPHLGPTRMREALDALADHAAVFGPNDREGFHLIGFRDRVVSVGAVLEADDEREAVLRRLRDALNDVVVLPPAFDVDEPGDLDRLRDVLRTWPPDGWRPRHTLALFAPP